MKKFIFALALLLGIFFIITRFTEVKNIAHILRQGRPVFIVLALLVEGLWFLNLSYTFREIYRIIGLNESPKRLLRLSISANFLNVIAPSGGVSGLAIFLADGRERGHSTARVTVAGALFILSDYIGLLTVVVIGMIILWVQDHLLWSEVVASVILLLGAVGLTVLLILGARSGIVLGDVLAWFIRKINRILHPFIHREYLSQEKARYFAEEIAEGIQELRHHPHELVRPLLLALNNKILLIIILALVFWAFQVPFLAETVVAGFSMGYLFVIVSPTPSGVGIVEGMLTLALTSLGVALEAATVITIAFRGVTFWIPLLIGMIAFNSWTKLQQKSQGK